MTLSRLLDTTSPTTHRVLVQQGGTYTAFESSNTAPFGVIRAIPHFEKELSACQPATSGIASLGLFGAAQLASGGYLLDPFLSGSVAQILELGVFDPSLNLIAETPEPVLLFAVADLNGDGISDLIGTSPGLYDGHPTEQLAIALGTAAASFSPPALYDVQSASNVTIIAVAIADLNGDHKPDLIVLSITFGSGQISVLLGNGDGTFQAAKVVAVADSSYLDALAVADLNADGKPDLVYTNGGGNPALVEVALGVGDGTFSTPVSYPVADTGALAIGDLNGDGIPDIVTPGVTMLFGDGKGGFPTRSDTLVEPTGNLIITDFNGDGIADVVTAYGDPKVMVGDAVTVLFGQGKGVFEGPPVSLIPNYPAGDTIVATIAAADLNGDGIPDLVSTDNLGHITVLKGAGDGTFQSSFQLSFSTGSGPGSANGVAFGDFNYDGNLDFAVVGGSNTASAVDILLGKGDGTFQSPLSVAAPLGAFALVAGDFNGDGQVDLALLLSNGVQILLGKGDGTFTAGALYSVGPAVNSFVAGDFNGDGKLDLVVADAGNIAFLAGNGDGTFAAPQIIPFAGGPAGGPFSVIAADFNKDGKLDLALTLSDGANVGGLRILLGRGDGTFQPLVSYAVDAIAVQTGDLNGDGNLDLVVTGTGADPSLRYLLGNGDGSFQPSVAFSSDIYTLYAQAPLALGDFNRDGKLDVAAITNAGVAAFLNTTGPVPPVTVVSAAGLTPGPLAPDSLATVFGSNFPATPSITIEDSNGTTLPGSILYSSASQINFAIPAGLDAGPATVTIGSQSASVLLAPLAPSLFTLNAGGLAAAYVTRVAPSGAVTNQPIANFKNGIYTPIPIDVTSAPAYLILFGTGIRNASFLTAIVNGGSLPLQYAGPQESIVGLDQVNLLLPSSLAGSGCSNIVVTSGLFSNTVYACIQ
jgi:uncharacterized protein (TIGR03437 family)